MDPSLLPEPTQDIGQLGAPYNDLQIGTMVAFGITYFMATFFLACRYFQAIKIVKNVEIDLIILTLCYGLALAYFITMVKLMDYGWARHMTEIFASNWMNLLEFNNKLLPNTLIYLITPAVTKIAMLTVLFKINPSATYRICVVVIGVCIFAYTLVLTYLTGGPCTPLKGDETIKCLMNVAISQSVLNIASDIAVILLPIPTIISLQLSFKQKLSVGGILALGSAVVICSIARLPYSISLGSSDDLSWEEGILGIWSIVEVNIGIVCGCAMRLKKLVTAYLPRMGWNSSQKKSTPYGSSWGGTTATGSKGGNKTFDEANGLKGDYQLHSVQKGGLEAGSTDTILK
ncbi:uncharacterized protein PODANS_3_5990 [Podospora anserina S mat+]|uniref:Podospora anserina S mat+ genomic DNA chromosome 3, supercontig 2 n=1 Tax=Podospora anserina (strain S / ATCC MYA-4624 / DSM 980 / FGSC 10383) TaxID=515849 RepID=B2B0J8_PODAN|nr:uncharacterized protein PODANS_3_5990 [Podospora anserina S mat+]CAP70533.1 unnamed protein product [Podospora anserina S mat+]CDP27120.1 Putative protein of unknown function [Podospora anserina S mat+]